MLVDIISGIISWYVTTMMSIWNTLFQAVGVTPSSFNFQWAIASLKELNGILPMTEFFETLNYVLFFYLFVFHLKWFKWLIQMLRGAGS